jgi:hypothetical protein
MPERSLLSRVLCAFGRLLRRLTIGLGALIIVVYYFGDRILAVWPLIPPARNGQNLACQIPRAMSPKSGCMVASSGSSTGSDPRAAGERLIRQARRTFQAEGDARAALARRKALAGGSRPSYLHIASDRSRRACPYHFYIWRRLYKHCASCANLRF